MAGYIGQAPANKFLTLDKQTFTTSATDTYSLDKTVSSANEIELFLNNVRQEPIEAYTVSGNTLTLASAITSSDTMYCIYQGKAIGSISPASNSVSNDMLQGSIATSKLADITANGITLADTWRVNTNFNPSTGTQVITANWERDDSDGYGLLGTGMTESSGIFSFPSNGYYLVMFTIHASHTGSNHYTTGAIHYTSDNSSYNSASETNFSLYADGNRYFSTGYTQKIFDITDITNHKIRFTTDIQASGVRIDGSSGTNQTNAIFIRLGDT